MTRRLHPALPLLAALCVIAAALTACDADSPQVAAPDVSALSPSPSDPDPDAAAARLAALFALVDSYHRQADAAADRQDLPAAADAMRALIQDLSAAPLDHPDRLLFLIDAHTRLARIQTQLGLQADALATLNDGLAWHHKTPRPTLFGGYLLQTKGDLLLDMGDDRGAVQAHKEAILVFKAVIDQTP